MIGTKGERFAPWPSPEELDRLVRRAEALAGEPESARRRAAIALARLAAAASSAAGGSEDEGWSSAAARRGSRESR